MYVGLLQGKLVLHGCVAPTQARYMTLQCTPAAASKRAHGATGSVLAEDVFDKLVIWSRAEWIPADGTAGSTLEEVSAGSAAACKRQGSVNAEEAFRVGCGQPPVVSEKDAEAKAGGAAATADAATVESLPASQEPERTGRGVKRAAARRPVKYTDDDAPLFRVEEEEEVSEDDGVRPGQRRVPEVMVTRPKQQAPDAEEEEEDDRPNPARHRTTLSSSAVPSRVTSLLTAPSTKKVIRRQASAPAIVESPARPELLADFSPLRSSPARAAFPTARTSLWGSSAPSAPSCAGAAGAESAGVSTARASHDAVKRLPSWLEDEMQGIQRQNATAIALSSSEAGSESEPSSPAPAAAGKRRLQRAAPSADTSTSNRKRPRAAARAHSSEDDNGSDEAEWSSSSDEGSAVDVAGSDEDASESAYSSED